MVVIEKKRLSKESLKIEQGGFFVLRMFLLIKKVVIVKKKYPPPLKGFVSLEKTLFL